MDQPSIGKKNTVKDTKSITKQRKRTLFFPHPIISTTRYQSRLNLWHQSDAVVFAITSLSLELEQRLDELITLSKCSSHWQVAPSRGFARPAWWKQPYRLAADHWRWVMKRSGWCWGRPHIRCSSLKKNPVWVSGVTQMSGNARDTAQAGLEKKKTCSRNNIEVDQSPTKSYVRWQIPFFSRGHAKPYLPQIGANLTISFTENPVHVFAFNVISSLLFILSTLSNYYKLQIQYFIHDQINIQQVSLRYISVTWAPPTLLSWTGLTRLGCNWTWWAMKQKNKAPDIWCGILI